MLRILSVALALTLASSTLAAAHQPITLLETDTTAVQGPLLVDGTISFAVRAAFTKASQKKAFRAGFKDGDKIAIQYLIIDKKPESTLSNSSLPTVEVTSPTGKKIIIKINERSIFYEPFSGTNFLYLARYTSTAEAGIYDFVITSHAKSAITLAVGQREVQGKVVRRAPAVHRVNHEMSP